MAGVDQPAPDLRFATSRRFNLSHFLFNQKARRTLHRTAASTPYFYFRRARNASENVHKNQNCRAAATAYLESQRRVLFLLLLF